MVLKDIKGHQVKLECKPGHPQAPIPVVNQLVVFLSYVGTEGNGSSGRNQKIQQVWDWQGFIQCFHHCATTAILSLRDGHCIWPDAKEQVELAKLAETESDFANCVGMADDILFSFAFEPEGSLLELDHNVFNKKLTKLRICLEHCINMLKGRFPWLRSIRRKALDNQTCVRHILHLLDATVILHNMLIVFCEEQNEDWICDNTCSIAMLLHCNFLREPMDELNLAIHPFSETDRCHRHPALDGFHRQSFTRIKS